MAAAAPMLTRDPDQVIATSLGPLGGEIEKIGSFSIAATSCSSVIADVAITVELAKVGYTPNATARRIISGVNWSVAIGNPFRSRLSNPRRPTPQNWSAEITNCSARQPYSP